MKRLIHHLFIVLAILFSTQAYTKSGALFQIRESGASASIDLILCLNGKGPISCQNYHVSAVNLAITTTIKRNYPTAGIKVVTPGYQVSGCTNPNEYCLFSVNAETSTPISLKETAPSSYTLGGSVSGLLGTLVLESNGNETLAVSADGAFIFTNALPAGSTYSVTVQSQPAMQTCTVNNGTGVITNANVTNISVTCTTNTRTVGGTVSGLTASESVVLQNNGADNQTVSANGTFTFTTPITEGSTYNVTILTQPSTQTCSVMNHSGIISGANVTNVSVICANNAYTVGGTVSGLAASESVVLQNSGADNQTISANGAFTFSTPIAEGATYNVTVLTQPSTQTCTVNNHSGTISGANVTNVTVSCTDNTYTVGGAVSGLAASESVVLQNNGTDNQTVSVSGSFTFATPIAQGATYSVTVLNQPSTQTCTVSQGSGTVGAGNVTNVQVTCTDNTYTVGGTVSGLAASESVVLQNNGTDNKTVSANGAYTFSTAITQGGTYNVTVLTQPSTQTCTVNNHSGTISGANVTNVTVTCADNTYTIGGTVSGLAASESVVLQNNGTDNQTVSANGAFTFTSPIAQGATYSVTVLNQPSTQTCTVNQGSGTVGPGNVTNVQVTCSTNQYTVGGTVSGLNGTVVLQNNGADNLSVNASGSFTFSTSVAQGATYAVTVFSSPASPAPGQTCSVTANGSGTMGGANVTNVAVNCVNNTLTSSVTTGPLALSVTGHTEYGVSGTPSSGVSRTITITNTDSADAVGFQVVYSGLPSTTTHSGTCDGLSTLPQGTTCTIQINPGADATSNNSSTYTSCKNGTAPYAGTVRASSTSAGSVSTSVVVLDYGCIYQSGYIFAFDDTTSTAGNVGGKVVSLVDQKPAYPNGIVWDVDPACASSPYCTNQTNAWSFLYGQNLATVTGSNNPSNAGTNGPGDTWLVASVLNGHNGNTNSPANYAAAVCIAYTDASAGHNDWYLPALCDLGTGTTCPAGTQQNIIDNLNGLVGASCAFGSNCIDSYYWSSTENGTLTPRRFAMVERYITGGASYQGYHPKTYLDGVRCVRNF